MKFGMIGLGKMGMNLVKNAVDHEIEVVAYDVNAEAVEEAGNYSEKITAVKSIDELLTELSVLLSIPLVIDLKLIFHLID